MSNAYDEALAFFKQVYLDMSRTDPEAAKKFLECVKLLGTGKPEEIANAYERYLDDPDNWVRQQARDILRECGPDLTFGQAAVLKQRLAEML